MAENERADDPAASIRPVWNNPPPAVVDGESVVMAMGSDSWPALGEAPPQPEPRPPPPAPLAQPSPAPPAQPAPRQGNVANNRNQGPVNSNPSHKYSSARRHQKSQRQNSNGNPNGASAFRGPILPPPHIHMAFPTGYGPGYHTFLPPYPNGRPTFYPSHNIPPGPSFSNRPPYFPGPGFVVGPNIGGPRPINYSDVLPHAPVRGPYPPRYSPGVPLQSPEMALREGIVKQIEYYFSDENLQNDHYLISLMDAQGWVPISIIANFKRIRRMGVEINFILNSLQSSSAIEVQGEKIRKRNNWRNWIPFNNDNDLEQESQGGSPSSGR